jgi:uncharacterized membrane protein
MIATTDVVEEARAAEVAAKDRQPKELRAERRRISPGGISEKERAVSVAGGLILAALGLSRRSVTGALVAGMGGALIYRGVRGYSAVYDPAAQETAAKKGMHVEAAFLIGREPGELYQFWRNFSNLPHVMRHLKSVDVIDEKRSRWVASAPKLAGGRVEWIAEVTNDIPDQLIAWRSIENSEVNHAGEIKFSRAPGERGTEVLVQLDYSPPAGRLGHWIATLYGESAQQQIRDDLRHFKRMIECGETVTTAGQPHGRCAGPGLFRKD